MAKLPQDFVDLLTELSIAKAEFLLVGGWAVILYGHVRATDDVGLFIRPTVKNSERVFAALEAFGAPLRAHAVTRSVCNGGRRLSVWHRPTEGRDAHQD